MMTDWSCHHAREGGCDFSQGVPAMGTAAAWRSPVVLSKAGKKDLISTPYKMCDLG